MLIRSFNHITNNYKIDRLKFNDEWIAAACCLLSAVSTSLPPIYCILYITTILPSISIVVDVCAYRNCSEKCLK